jgi:type IV pilus assembly protein PilN
MAHINLLPWRENLRKQRKRNFFLQLLAAMVAALLALLLWHLQVQEQIQYQERRNAFLKAEIVKLDKKIREIRELEKRRAELIARMSVIQQLQVSRPQVVHLFDELVTTIPEGVYLEKLSQTGGQVTLEGWAQSNARVSAYMRNIDKSIWMTDADLKIIQNKSEKAKLGMSQFRLVAKQVNPNAESDQVSEGSEGKEKKG